LIRLDHYISLTSPKHADRLHSSQLRSSGLNLSKRRTAEVSLASTQAGSHPQEGRPARTPPPTFLFLPDSQFQTAGLSPPSPRCRRAVETPRFRHAPESSDHRSFEELDRRAVPPRRRRAEGAIYASTVLNVNCGPKNRAKPAIRSLRHRT
jgi:hypothetical protein